MPFPAFGELGCCEYVWMHLPDTFPAAWANIDSAPDIALMLVRLSFDWDEVVGPALALKDHMGDRLNWRTPESAHNAVLHMCELIPEAELELCRLYREKYSVVERLLAFLSSGPVQAPDRIEPVYLGRPRSPSKVQHSS